MENLKKKILLILLGGLAFGYSYIPGKQWKVLKEISREWKKIKKEEVQKNIRNLYKSKLVEKRRNSDGSYTLVLTDKGRIKALTYRFQDMKIGEKKWDNKWRLVIFDIPEKIKKGRDALRERLKKLGFYELQKSVFIFPYDCQNELDFLIEFFGLREYVRVGILEKIDNETHLKNIFNLRQKI